MQTFQTQTQDLEEPSNTEVPFKIKNMEHVNNTGRLPVRQQGNVEMKNVKHAASVIYDLSLKKAGETNITDCQLN